MTNYEMIVKKCGGSNSEWFEKLAHELYAKYCTILNEKGKSADADIVRWLHQDASLALDSIYDPGNLLIDGKGRYFISNGYECYRRDDALCITSVKVICSDGTSSEFGVTSLGRADIPQQILDLVKSQLLEKIKEHCPIAKEVNNAK